MSDEQTLDRKIPWLFFLAMVSQRIANFIFLAYLIFYVTERMLMTAVIMGAVMFAVRVFDLIFGAATGVIIQKVCLKHGQYRTWLACGPFIYFLGATMCFINPAIPMMAKAVMVFVGYALSGGAMNFIQVSQNGLMSRVAGPNMAVRGAISAKLFQGQQLGNIIAAVITMPLILRVEEMGADGYSVIQAALALLGAFGQLPLFFLTKKFDAYDPNFKQVGGASVKLGAMFRETLKNGQLLLLFVADSLRWAAYMSLSAIAAYYFRYVAQNMAMLTLALTTQSVAGLLGSIAGRPISKKLGKKGSGIVTGIFCAAFFAGLALWGQSSAYIYIICLSGVYFFFGVIGAWGVNLYLDCGEYQLYKTGKDNRTFIMGFYTISIKIGFILSSTGIAALLELSGYNGAANTVANVPLMVILMGGILGGFLLLYTLVMLLYGITDEKSREYAEHNHRAAQAAKEAG
ncbi:MAG: MFS transporter [Spirochaetaceae bacterium]|jgi:Na+/melibiose symporter-like transporter|nr:MFS transporter [Spirochaetaceae bacterium]